MEPQGTPKPSEQPNGNSEPAPLLEESQVSSTPAVEQPSEPVVTQAPPTVEVSQSASPQPADPVQVSSQPVADTSLSTAQPVVGTPISPLSPTPSKRRWLLPAVLVIAVVLLGAGGYTFAFYIPNRPGAVYASSLKRTGEAVDTLVTYSNKQAQKQYKSYGVDGKISVTADSTSFDATLSGSVDLQANATATLSAGIMGQHVSVDLKSVHVAGSSSPDIYLRASGVKTALDAAGASSLDGLDGQWLSIDHTLLNSYAANYGNGMSMAANSLPTAAQSQDALAKIQTVNKQYLFTTNSTHAVLQNKKYVGKETKDGRSVYHYTVGYNKTHLKSYVDALSSALDGSSLNNWSKKANAGKSLSEALDVSSLKTAVDGAKANYTFDMWVDTKTKLVQSVQFGDVASPGSTFTLAQNYTSGTSYPFTFSYQGKLTDGTTESSSLKLTVDTATDKETGVVTMNAGSTKLGLNFTVTPSTKGVDVTAPTGAKSVADLLSGLGLGGL